MATPFLGGTKPTVGGSSNTWGTLLNSFLDLIDTFAGKLKGAATVDVASAATCDIGAAACTSVRITGTTTITSFGTTANCIRFVRFGGNLTLTYNVTTLILLGSASRAIRSGDYGVYESDGSGNWRERSFTRALGTNNRNVTRTPANPTGTASASFVMMGLGAASVGITASMTGSFEFTVTGSVTNTGTNDTTITGRYGTGSAPANAAAVTGTALLAADKKISTPSAGFFDDFTFSGEITGLLVGTTYWFDLAIKANSGTSTISNLTVRLVEVPD